MIPYDAGAVEITGLPPKANSLCVWCWNLKRCMGRKRPTPEELTAKLYQVDVLVAWGADR
jgi:hypothetical protein